MTLTCPQGHHDVELIGDNGATDGTQTRVERYECNQCGREFTKVLEP